MDDFVYLSPDEIRGMKREISELERMLAIDEKSPRPKISDKAEFMADLKKKKSNLAEHSPKRVSGEEANRLYGEAKRLRGMISDRMMGRGQFFKHYPKDALDSDFERSVKAQMSEMRDQEFQKNIRVYKNIMRRIDPDDPTITNIEALRR